MKKKKYRVLFLGVLILFLFWQLKENRKITLHIPTDKGKELVLTMPLKDKKRLEYLFYDMVVLDNGGYTLFKNKPMYMGGFLKPIFSRDWRLSIGSLILPNLRMRNSWETWEKYQHHFKDSDFLIWAEENPFMNLSDSAISIILVSKTKLRQTIETYIQDFKMVLKKENLTFEDLLKEAKEKPFLKEVVKGHDGLIGTLFGFGRSNAWLFYEREQGKEVPLAPIWGEEVLNFMDNRPLSNWWWFGDCSAKIEDVLGYPFFLADPNSSETNQLKKEFLETRTKILEYYKDKDFLIATLTLLLNGNKFNESDLF